MRVRALQFASWAPSAGVLLVLASELAVAITNSPLGPGFTALWDTGVSLGFGNARFSLPLVSWINDGLLNLFFMVVGLAIQRELTYVHLSQVRTAAPPLASQRAEGRRG